MDLDLGVSVATDANLEMTAKAWWTEAGVTHGSTKNKKIETTAKHGEMSMSKEWTKERRPLGRLRNNAQRGPGKEGGSTVMNPPPPLCLGHQNSLLTDFPTT